MKTLTYEEWINGLDEKIITERYEEIEGIKIHRSFKTLYKKLDLENFVKNAMKPLYYLT